MRLVQVQVLRVREFDSRPLLGFASVVKWHHGSLRRSSYGFDSRQRLVSFGGLAQVVERSIRIRQVGGSMPPISKFS